MRLGHRWIVALVVSPPAVADDVDDDVSVELLTIGKREFGNTDDRFGVIAVDMKDGRMHRLSDVGGVDGAAPVAGKGSETKLVVEIDSDGATGGEPG